MKPVIDLNNLSVQFGAKTILKDLTAELRGRAIGLLGPNGAGKTTLIHTLLGFHPPSNGTAHLFGQDIRAGVKEIGALIGYMPERDSFIAKMSCVVRQFDGGAIGFTRGRWLERATRPLYVGLGEARYRNLETYSLA